MARGVALFLVGSLVLVALAGCGRWFEQREPWRHDAEAECMQSGAVRQSPAVTPISPIEGPGICGADFPLKVAALGSSPALGFADEARPPAAIPASKEPPAYPRELAPPAYPPYGSPYRPPPDRPPPYSGGPLTIGPGADSSVPASQSPTPD